MSQYIDGNCKTFIAGGDIGRYLRVKLSGGVLALAGATDKELGTAERDAFAANDEIAVRLRTASGTQQMVAAAAITEGAAVFTAANGRVSATQAAGAFLIGDALMAAGADGDVIEVLRNSHGDTAGS